MSVFYFNDCFPCLNVNYKSTRDGIRKSSHRLKLFFFFFLPKIRIFTDETNEPSVKKLCLPDIEYVQFKRFGDCELKMN